MSTQRYSVTPHPIETLLTWVKSGEIAIPGNSRDQVKHQNPRVAPLPTAPPRVAAFQRFRWQHSLEYAFDP